MVGFTTRSALWACCCVLPLFVITCLAQVPPGVPIISGTQVIIQGNTITLTCTVTGGDPSPSVKWLRDDVIIDDSYTQNGNTVQNNYTFVASAKEHLAVFECQSENGVLQNPLSRTKFVEVYKPPSDPVLTGPTDFLSGTPGTWTCTTTGAYPVPTMKMRIENSEFADPQFTSTPAYDVSQANFNVTGTLTWSPTTANDKQKIYCDVYHPQTGDDVRTADLQLNVGSPLAVNAPQTLYETNTGKTITLQCVVTSGTATQIRWYKNNRQLNLAANFRLTGGNPNNPSLTIANVLMSDAGNYLCEATDGTATKNTSVITVTTKASPTTPVLTGPSSVTSGNTKTWTCVSKGGNPQPTMTMRIGNRAFSSELTVNSVLDSTTNTYDVTGTLSWAPQSTDNNGIIYCDVTHETLDAPQTVNLPLTVNTPPQPPTLTGPTDVKSGTPYTWTCTSVGAFPEQTMNLRLGNTPISNGVSTNSVFDQGSKLYTVTSTLSWTPSSNNAGNTLFCDVFHPETLGQTPQTANLPLNIQSQPQTPTLTGPSEVVSGTTETWTCVSKGGNPSPTMSMRIGNTIFNNELSVSSVLDQSTNSYTVTGTLQWAPNGQHNQQILHCDVSHPETLGNTPQTVDLPLTVKSQPQTPTLTGPSEVVSGTTETWTCVSKGGNPSPTMSMRIGNTIFNNELSVSSVLDQSTNSYTVTGTLQWAPNGQHNQQILHCDVSHPETLGNIPQTVNLPLTVRSQPQTPTLTGPSTVISGTTKTWTCVSVGGNPAPTMSIRIGNTVLVNQLSVSSTLDQTTNTYRVTGTLTWAPTSDDNQQTLFCDVSHPETLGNSPQTVNLPLTVHTPPNNPKLTGPNSVVSGEQKTWTCVSTGAYPEQSMSMRIGDRDITNGFVTNSDFNSVTKLYTVTGTLTWAPSSNNHDETLYCDVTHQETLGQTPQTASLQLTVQTQPQTPTLTGPSTVISGTTKTWTCVSVGGNPAPTMSIRIGNTVLVNQLSVSSTLDQTTNTYRVTGTLTWAPTSDDNQQTLFCDVSHPETLGNSPQTVNLPLTVHTPPNNPKLTGPNSVVSGEQKTWTCVSTGAYPEQSMSMRIGDRDITNSFVTNSDFNSVTKLYTVTGTLTWAPSSNNHDETLYCDVTHQETLGQTPQTASLQLTVQTQPQTPTLTGPSTVISGTTKTWTCVSIGGNPAPTMAIRIGNTVLTNQLSVSSTLDQTTNTYRVTGTLTWAPTSEHNQQTLFCDVSHPETLGNSPQTVNLPLTVHTPPKNPTLTGPTSVVTGQQYTWTCVSIGAYPEQTMSMREGNNNINSGFVTNSDYNSVTKLYTMTGTLTWSPTNSNQDTLNCDVMHTQTLGQNPQTAVLPLSVQSSPQTPTLTGPRTVISGTTNTWTCTSIGGNPEPSMSIRIGNTVLSNELSVSSVLEQSTNTYRVTGTLSWAPSSIHNQQTIFCDVQHDTLNKPQTVNLPLTVHTPPKNPVLTGPNNVVTGKQYTWTCVSTGAFPEQTLSMRVGSTSITNGFVTNSDYNSVSKLYTMTGTLTWSPASNNNDDTLFCDVFHTQTLGQTPQTASLQLSVTTSPQQPTLTGPSTVTSGTTNTWTCVSIGGNPDPRMSMRIENTGFNREFTTTSVLDQTSNTYRVTGTLSWAPGSHHNQLTLFCDVEHDTLDRPQTVNLPLTVLTPPKVPQLTGPTLVVAGKQSTWTCVSTGAYPEQTMSMRIGGNDITQGFVTNSEYNAVTKLYTMTGTLNWSPASSNNQDTLFCDVVHTPTLGQSPQTASLQLNVQTSPQRPTISGPNTVISGTSTTWTCISTGGNPEPTMSIRIGNNVFSQEVNVNSVFDQSSNTYRVTGTLAWAPQSYHNQMTIYCDVEQPETMDRPQTVSLPLTVITSPKNPVLRGPSTVEAGKQYTWTCTSSGANPEQTMSMRLGNNAIQDGLVTDSVYNTASKLYTMTGTLTWTPSGNNHEDTLFCDVFHTQTLGQTPQTASLQLLVQTQPNKPTLTGPTTVTAGSSNTWTCLSIGGNPEPEMSIRINDRVFSQEVTVNSVYDQSSKSFRTTGTLTWAPSSRFNLETLYCDVLHEETSDRVQTVNLPLTVISPPNNPVLSGPTTIKAGAQDTWTCTSTGAYPEQTMSMRLGGNAITSGFATTAVYNGASKTYTVTGTLSWSPASSNNGDVLYCDVFHTPTLGNSPQTASLTLNVQNSPQRPQLSGPTTVTAGSSNTWTCTSVGGNPEPTMSIRYENQVFNNEVTFSSNYDDTSKSFRVTGTLAWAPSSIHNLQSLYCDVYHPETLGSTPQTVNLALTVLSPPRPPVLTGPTTVRAGTQSKWTCTSVGAYPEQSMSMRIGNSDITQGFYTNTEYNAMTKQYMVVGTLEWAPTSTNQGETLFCDVTHQETLGQTPQTASLQLSVQSSPQRPTLTGPTTTISGTSYTWTCVSTGGNPEAAMSMRVGNRVFANEVQVNSVFDQTSRSYRVTGTLSWAPASSFNGETLYCDVTHDTLGDRVQTVTLPLVVYTPPSPPQLSGPTTVTSGQSNTWTCVSNGAYPEQKMSMRIGTTTINSGITYNAVYDSIQKLYKVTGTLVWSPATNNNGDTLFCDVTHTETSGQTQTDSLDLTIYTTPQLPLLTGPTKMVAGTSLTWSCVSIGGFPQQQMSMRIGSTDLSNFLTINAVYDANTKLYRVTGTLAWAPSISHDGEVLSCDVYHQQTLGNVPQTASLRELDVQAAIDVTVPRTNYAPKEDDDVTLDCVVSSGVATSVTWYKDNVALQVASTERYSGATPNSPSLTISKVTLNDRGNYVCGATDGMSTDQSATVFVQPVEKVWTEHVIITYILDGYNKLVRPQDPLVNVTHNLVPRHFLHFDGRNLTVQAMQCMKWNDPRLTWPKGQNKVSLPASEIWTPDVVLLGEKYIPDFSTKVSVTKAGNVIYCPQGPIMASDCQEKSGEVHECAFKFLSWSYDLVMLDIRLPPNRNADSLVDLSMFVEHDTYEITSRCGVRNEMTYSCRDGTYAELTYSLVVRRRRQFCRNFNENPVCN